MDERRAKQFLEERVQAGAKLAVAREADLPTLKRLRARCHAAGIPAMLGPCASGG